MENTKVTAENLTAAAVSEIVNQSLSTGRHIKIKGYVTSKAQVFDYVVVPCAYLELIDRSMEKLDDVNRPEFTDEASWNQAKAEIRESLQKSMDGSHRHPKPSRETSKVCDFVSADAHDASLVILRSLEQISCEQVGGAATPEVKSKTPVTAAKKIINSKLAKDKFVGQLNLNRGKFDSIELI